MTSDQGPPWATACWDWSHNAPGSGGLWEKCSHIYFFSCTGRFCGQLLTARSKTEGFSGKKKKKKRRRRKDFWGRSGGARCVYVGEYKWAHSHRTGSCTNYFFLGKHSWKRWRDKRRGRRRDESRSHFAFFISSDSSKSEDPCRSSLLGNSSSRRVFGLITARGRDDVVSPPHPNLRSVHEQRSVSHRAPDLLLTFDLWAPGMGTITKEWRTSLWGRSCGSSCSNSSS